MVLPASHDVIALSPAFSKKKDFSLFYSSSIASVRESGTVLHVLQATMTASCQRKLSHLKRQTHGVPTETNATETNACQRMLANVNSLLPT